MRRRGRPETVETAIGKPCQLRSFPSPTMRRQTSGKKTETSVHPKRVRSPERGGYEMMLRAGRSASPRTCTHAHMHACARARPRIAQRCKNVLLRPGHRWRSSPSVLRSFLALGRRYASREDQTPQHHQRCVCGQQPFLDTHRILAHRLVAVPHILCISPTIVQGQPALHRLMGCRRALTGGREPRG